MQAHCDVQPVLHAKTVKGGVVKFCLVRHTVDVKVAIVAEWLDPWRGGAETSTHQFIHQLMDRGVDLHLFTRSRPSPTPGLDVHCVNGPAISRARQTRLFINRVDRELSGHHFDVVHAITPCRSATVYQPRGGTLVETIERNIAMRSSRPARSLKRLGLHLNRRQQWLLRLERKLMTDPQGPLIVALSEYVADQLRRHYGVPDSRIRKIFNGVDLPQLSADERSERRERIRREYQIPSDELLVVCVAHNFRLKGVHRWMQALALLRAAGRRDVRSLVLGRGESAAWHRLARRLKLADSLTFVGQTDRIEEFYAAGDLLVHPTYYDPCSRVVLEALAHGLPCVTSRWDGSSELITEGVNGYVLADPGDVRALAKAVEKLHDPKRRAEMSAAAREAAAGASMARHTAEMTALYAELERTRGSEHQPQAW